MMRFTRAYFTLYIQISLRNSLLNKKRNLMIHTRFSFLVLSQYHRTIKET